jgi:hypothetical protein
MRPYEEEKVVTFDVEENKVAADQVTAAETVEANIPSEAATVAAIAAENTSTATSNNETSTEPNS